MLFGQTIQLDSTFNANGRLVLDFQGDTASDYTEYANCIGLQSDGRIVIGGEFGSDYSVIRLLSDGTLDTTFGSGGQVRITTGSCEDLILLSDDRIVTCGRVGTQTGSLNDTIHAAVIRLLPDGELDTAFADGGVFYLPTFSNDDAAYGLCAQTDGKILVTGNCDWDDDGWFEMFAARLEPQGVLDQTFSFDGVVTKDMGGGLACGFGIDVMGDGRIVFGGWARNFLEYSAMVCRVMTNGAVDPTFGGGDGIAATVPNFYEHLAFDLLLQPDGKPVLSGRQTGGYDIAMFRFDLNGVLDPSFAGDGIATAGTGAEAYDFRSACVMLPDGSFIAVGKNFGPFVLVHYAADGSVEEVEATGFEVPSAPRDIVRQPDGKILVCGSSHSITAEDSVVVTRYTLDVITEAPEHNEANEGLSVYPNPAVDVCWVSIPSAMGMGAWGGRLTDMTGRTVKEFSVPSTTAALPLDLSDLLPGAYCMTVATGSCVRSVKLVLRP